MEDREHITITIREHVNGFSVTGFSTLDGTFLDEISESRDDIMSVLRQWALKQMKVVV